MLPYFEQPALDLGPITLYAFGALTAAAILVGLALAKRRAAALDLDAGAVERMGVWILLAGFVGAHLVDRLVYAWPETMADPGSLFRLWEGLSSYGGLLGGALAAFLLLRRPAYAGTRWRYVDAMAFAVPWAWLLGRIGCFFAYDHVGVVTDSPIGQVYRDGLVRHNLGLEEALFWAAAAPLLTLAARRPWRPGAFAGLVAVAYGPFRFFLDFLRAEDARHLGLTGAQFGALALTVLGLWLLLRRAQSPSAPETSSTTSSTSRPLVSTT